MTFDLIKTSDESLYLWHTSGQQFTYLSKKRSAWVLNQLKNIISLGFCWNIWSSSIAYGFTLFCVFVPFVFKLWLSGSILHLSSNLVAVTPSYQLQTCATQKCLLIKLSLNKFKCSQFWLISFDMIHVIKIWHSLRCCRNEGALCQQNFDNIRPCLIKIPRECWVYGCAEN